MARVALGLGGLLRLGPSWGPGGPPGVRRFDGSWRRLGALLGPSWALLPFKMVKKSFEISIKKMMHLGIDFWKDFGGFLEAKWRHVGTKIDQKSML